MNFKNIKLVTLDATNTLLTFRVPPWEDEHGFEGTSDELRQQMLENTLAITAKYPLISRFSISWTNWWRRVVKPSLEGEVPDNSNPDNMANHLIEFQMKKYWDCADGAERLLRSLKDKHITVGVITNSDPCLNEILRSLCESNSIDFFLTSYEARYNMSDDSIFQEAIGSCRLRVKPSESLHIGYDEQKDYAGARAAGWHALVVADNTYCDAPPATTRHIFKSLDKLAFAIENNQLNLA